MDSLKLKENAQERQICTTWKRRTLLERYLAALCLLLFVVFLVMIGVLLHLKNVRKTAKKEICLSNVCKRRAGSILTNMDFTVDPCENFYEFSCGSQLKYKSIYDEKIRTFTNLKNYLIYLAKDIIEKPESAEDHLFVNKVKKYYQSCLNKPSNLKEVIKEVLRAISQDDWPLLQDDNSRNLIEEASALEIIYKDTKSLFRIVKNPNDSYISIYKGSTLVDLNALLETMEKFITMKEEYVDLIDYVFTKSKLSIVEAKTCRDEIIDFETSLAQTQEKMQNDILTNLTITELESKCPQIKWRYMFKYLLEYLGHGEKYSDEYHLQIFSMDYVNDICKLVGETKPRIIYNYIIWNVIVPYLIRFDYIFRQLLVDKKDSLNFSRREKEIPMLPGMKALKWKMCIIDMEHYIRLGLDYMMINSIPMEEEIKEVKSYAEDLIESMDEIFSGEDWIDDYTKNITRFILNKIESNIGFGNQSLNEEFLNEIFDNINININYAENIFSAKKETFSNRLFNPKISQYLNFELIYPPFKVGANFHDEPVGGIIEIPLGILQSPYYSYKLPQYLNFGGIAVVIGHEITHRYDHLDFKVPELPPHLANIDTIYSVNWPEKFLEEYTKRKVCLVNQYSQFPLEGNDMVNGNLTIRDNFADNSGLTMAFRAYQKYLKKQGDEPQLPGLDFTNRQMFFIGYAQLWCETIESMKKTFESDVHSPGKYRVLVPLMNSREFSEVFNCPLKSYMNPEHKCIIWS